MDIFPKTTARYFWSTRSFVKFVFYFFFSIILAQSNNNEQCHLLKCEFLFQIFVSFIALLPSKFKIQDRRIVNFFQYELFYSLFFLLGEFLSILTEMFVVRADFLLNTCPFKVRISFATLIWGNKYYLAKSSAHDFLYESI